MTAALEARGVAKSFGKEGATVEVLRGIDLVIEAGEFVAITGPSGSGKSTLLYLFGALDRPTRGDILIQGRSTASLGDRELALLRNKEIGFVFQFHFLLPELTAWENATVPLLIAGMPLKKAKVLAFELLEKLGLGHRVEHYPKQLSGGEQQRVAIARALIHKPAILLGDELTGNLDSKNSREIYELLRSNHRETGQTTVIVTHNPELAMLADRKIVIVDGSIQKDEKID